MELRNLNSIKILLTLSGLIASSSCVSIPEWHGKLYAGDSERASVRRAQDNEEIGCQEPKFDEMICMTYEDYRSFIDTYIMGCAKWKKKKKADALEVYLRAVPAQVAGKIYESDQ